jgi:lipopolysaccharide biosynthesis protein
MTNPWRERRWKKIIKSSGFFDVKYYLFQYSDVRVSGIDPIDHYIKHGAAERRNPSAAFDTSFYLERYKDVRDSRINPLVHYILHGKDEGRIKSFREIEEGKKTNIEKEAVIRRSASNPQLTNRGFGYNQVYRLIRYIAQNPRLVRKVFHYIRDNGIKRTIGKITLHIRANPSIIFASAVEERPRFTCDVVPFYIDPFIGKEANVPDLEGSIAVHLYLSGLCFIEEIIDRMKMFDAEFDLYLSITDKENFEETKKYFTNKVPGLRRLFVKPGEEVGGGIGSLVVNYGKQLSAYSYICHISNAYDSRHGKIKNEYVHALDLILGMPGQNKHHFNSILRLLIDDAKLIYPSKATVCSLKDPTCLANEEMIIKTIVERYSILQFSDYHNIELPDFELFWARSVTLTNFVSIPMCYSDFAFGSKRLDNTSARAIVSLIPYFAANVPGRIYRICDGDSISDYRYYEDQRNFKKSIVKKDVKILAYFLPQFHPTPENNEWHGDGFTEWTKVRGAYPLFAGHYQQHVPHSDIGYYLLDSVDVLHKQAELMRSSGVYGQVFYHYWFSGKLILEEPARMLLENKNVNMPFCFCWANENWTRRWDGNEDEILLGQVYSIEDAKEFIRYLIPFFRDSRYIVVDNRPILFIYRPASIPNVKQYIDVWRAECRLAGVHEPYVVAVLTRGATDPQDFDMDAGVERTLHDWTNSNVPELNNDVFRYHEVNGSILPYDKVAEYYENQTDIKCFTYFRSISPIWDNTARYAEGAFLLHGSTPRRFQIWLEKLLDYTEATLPKDRQFIVVNAWNEWAEGAHLEPDSRYGYSYLNSVGRALSGISYDDEMNVGGAVSEDLRICISLADELSRELLVDVDLKDRFVSCIVNSSVFDRCVFVSDSELILNAIDLVVETDKIEWEAELHFRFASLFDRFVLEKMVQTFCFTSGSAVIANLYSQRFELFDISENGSTVCSAINDAAIALVPKRGSVEAVKNVRVRSDARSFATYPCQYKVEARPKVTTIVRFHALGSMNELKSALYSLASMAGCVVQPFIAAQDLDATQKELLESMVCEIPFAGGITARFSYYQSTDNNSDLRSVMLNESLKMVSTRYAAFLDYDDLLFPDAYMWLIGRLNESGKAVTFGRVYDTKCDADAEVFLERGKKYEYNFSYDEFVNNNHAPIHSFMLDLSKLDLSRVEYHPDQKYMEDYFLTLQIFTRNNSDWDSLRQNRYIGDYIYNIERQHTLAISDEVEREKLLNDRKYKIDAARINLLRDRLKRSG